MGSRQFCRGRGRGRGREVEAEARQGRGRELEVEARQTKFEARLRRRPAEKSLLPLWKERFFSNSNSNSNSSAKFGRFKSNCMTKGKWPRGPALNWVEVIYVIPLYGVSRGLNLNLSSVGGRALLS